MAQELPRGTVRDSDGRVYWGSYKAKLKSGEVVLRQLWLTLEKYATRRTANRECSKASRKRNAEAGNAAGMLRKNSVKRAQQKAAELYPLRKLVASAKLRAAKKGLAFDITTEDFRLPTHCPLLGIPLKKGAGKIEDGSPSLDRIAPQAGYVKGNVWVISFRANATKQNATLEELELLVENLRKSLGK